MIGANIKTLVISLKDAHSRRDKVASSLATTSLPWEFLDAVDGRKLSVPPPKYNPIKVERLLGFQLTPGEIGCFNLIKKHGRTALT